MTWLDSILDSVKKLVRSMMRSVAKALNRISGGRITPNSVTIVSLLAHIPIAWLIATNHYRPAGLLLIVFGLFDTLDGELARLQNRSSSAGMFLDSVTDRIKEILLYVGAAYSFVSLGRPYMVTWAVLACGVSLLTSYANAWGEVVMRGHKSAVHQTNKTLRTGLMGFEVRMTLFIVGLLSTRLILAVVIIAILTTITALQRIYNVMRALRVQS